MSRSVLSVPGSNWGMIEKAVGLAADMVMIDLEDAVAPSAKAASRASVVRALRELNWGGSIRAYRVNGLDTPYFYRDLMEVVEQAGDRLDVVVVPKVGRPEDIYLVATLLAQIELHIAIPSGHIKIGAQIESAQGMVQVEQIAAHSPRLVSLHFGPGDYAASVGMPVTGIGVQDEYDAQYPGHRLHYAMTRMVVAARAAGVQAIDGPYADFRDLDGFRAACRRARGLGYEGKWCIHPDQIAVANEIFSPTASELSWAEQVIAAYEAATAAGTGVIAVDGRMLDAASVRMARAIRGRAGPAPSDTA